MLMHDRNGLALAYGLLRRWARTAGDSQATHPRRGPAHRCQHRQMPELLTRRGKENERSATFLSAMAVIALHGSCFGEPRTKQNSKGETIEVSNLEESPGHPCLPSTFAGRVVKRDFAEDAIKLTGITIENRDGTRIFINVEIPSNLSMATLGNVVDGLQRLTKVGRYAKGSVYACGMAGRVLTLDEIK
jgi:hypothetical protein